MLEEQFRNALIRHGGNILARVGQNVIEGHKPPKNTFPVITFRRVSTQSHYSHEGRRSINWSRIAVHCWDTTPVGARTLAALVIAALPTFDLMRFDASTVTTSSPNQVLNQFADEWADPEPIVFREVLDLKIWFTE